MPIFILFCLGAIAGSYLMASVWRIKQAELVGHAPIRMRDDYSRCLDCGYKLKWYDLVPIISWLSLGGKCRKCKSRIGWAEIFLEVFVGLLFILTYLFWPFRTSMNSIDFLRISVWFCFVLASNVLFIYDFKWQELPSVLLYALIALGFVFASTVNISQALLSASLLGGLYFILHLLSKGTWVGDGDGYLGLALGLVLGNWQLAFVALFVANLIGLVAVLPSLMSKKVNPSTQVALGPLLILGFYICFFAQNWIFSLITL